MPLISQAIIPVNTDLSLLLFSLQVLAIMCVLYIECAVQMSVMAF